VTVTGKRAHAQHACQLLTTIHAHGTLGSLLSLRDTVSSKPLYARNGAGAHSISHSTTHTHILNEHTVDLCLMLILEEPFSSQLDEALI